MPTLRTRADNGRLYIDFHYDGRRCRELLPFVDIPGERRRAERLLHHLRESLAAGTFRYADFFPDSKHVAEGSHDACFVGPMSVRSFVPIWLNDMTPQWSSYHLRTVREILSKHVLPAFGDRMLHSISRADVLRFRAELAKCPGYRGNLTPSRINKVMTLLRQLLKEAAGRFDFEHPFREIKPLRMKRSDVRPFSLEEVEVLIHTIEPHYRNYLVTRFFTGMRSGEINGLRWPNVDLSRGLILVRETLVVGGVEEGAKTERSIRDIPMVPQVRKAIEAQLASRSPDCPWVFPTPRGFAINAKNFNNRVWKPLLEAVGLPTRRAYQTRHTAATLMLAAGENPEWVAYVLGHTNLQMLFRVYSRFIPNLTRQDGSALTTLLDSRLKSSNAPPEGV